MSDAHEPMSFEDALKRLEVIVQQLESGALGLDDSIKRYTEGEALRARCETLLKSAQARIEAITLGPDAKPTGTRPFDGD